MKKRGREPIPFTAETIIVTSALSPAEIYRKLNPDDNIGQLYRRFDVGLKLPDSDTIWEIQNGTEVIRG